jgi:hypothetical protein
MSAKVNWRLVTHAYNPSYLGGWAQEDRGSRPAQAKSSQDPPISKITREKWTRGLAQVVEHLVCKCKAQSSNSCPNKTNKKLQQHECTALQFQRSFIRAKVMVATGLVPSGSAFLQSWPFLDLSDICCHISFWFPFPLSSFSFWW